MNRRIRNLYDRAFHWSVQAWRKIKNYHPAGQRWGRDRSIIHGEIGDPHQEVSPAERSEIVRKCHAFEQRNGVVNQLADLMEQYTVGHCGIQFIPASSSPEWNAAAKKFWDAAQENIDQCSLQSFGTLQAIIARAVHFRDGESYILLTNGTETRLPVDKSKPKFPMPVSRPRIQVIESHRIKTPPGLHDQEGRTIFDGVRVDGRRRTVGYYVQDVDPDGNETFRFRTTEELIQVGEPSRAGELRYLPIIAPVLDDIHDLDDLQILGMRAAKNQARLANLIKNATGELSRSALTRRRFQSNNQDASGNAVDEERYRHIQQVTGATTFALKKGEELEQLETKAPSEAARWLWEYLTWKICAGVGIPKILVYPQSIQGTIGRGEYDRANAFFRSRSAVLASFFKRVYLYFIEWGIENVRELANPPADYMAVKYRAPRAVNVDVGRNSAAVLAEIEAGGGTWEGYYSALGEDYVEQLTQKAREAALIHELASEYKVTPGEISKPVVEALVRLMEAQAKEKQANHIDDEDEPPAAVAA